MKNNFKNVDWKWIFIGAGLMSTSMIIMSFLDSDIDFIPALCSGIAFPIIGLLLVIFPPKEKPKSINQQIAELEQRGIYISIIFAGDLSREGAWKFQIDDIDTVLFRSARYPNKDICKKMALERVLKSNY